MDASNGMQVGPTWGGGNGYEVDIQYKAGAAIVHSHGECDSPQDFRGHRGYLGANGLSAIYTLSGGYLWVQWFADGAVHGTPEQIYNVCAAVGGVGCGH